MDLAKAQLLASKQAELDGMYRGIQFSNPQPSWWQQGNVQIGNTNPTYTLCTVSNSAHSYNASDIKNGA